MEKRPITIKDVATYCSVSVATVSRVLNNIPSVNPSLQKKVNDAIKKLNYVPNRLAIGLKNNYTHTIGLIVIDICNPAQMSIAREIEAYIAQFGYVLLIISSDDNAEKEKTAVKTLTEYMVDGIILTGTGKNDEFLLSVQNSGTPVVVLDRRPSLPSLNYVGVDKQNGCYKAVKHMLELGYRHIGLINGPHDIPTSFDRFNGLIRALYDFHLPVYNESIFNGPFTSSHGRQSFQTLWSRKERPDAIISGGELITVGILEAARELGVRIPRDIGILSFGNIENPSLVDTELSYLESSPEQVGRRGAELLLEQLNNPGASPSQIVIESDIVKGNSLTKQNP